ncbi:cellulase family glycosylhydrolase [Streptomyces fradiae]|uniref:cellulase family glycosylhydrolase n=1 Tax=Streptomyces fradiae TaxID=1906 RepID=UPI0029420ED4|nr:cellulase family glycosylhydrolase [Streptomyces fradiae]WOI60654.1 cellulase family glycosylhydrolase [Streptomyces fradiae]
MAQPPTTSAPPSTPPPARRPGRARRLRALAAGVLAGTLLWAAGPADAAPADALRRTPAAERPVEPPTAGQAAGRDAAPPPRTDSAAAPGDDWLHTRGNRIVDAHGNEVRLTGANWFGFNTTERVFHGLWSVNITETTRAMAQRGINIVRVPVSTQLLLEWRDGRAAVPSAVNAYANPELAGKTTLEVFDHWLDLCEQYGVKVMLDVHSAEADNAGHVHPVWWKGAVTTEDFHAAWEWVTARYRGDDTLVAMDIKNEPHGGAGDSPRAKWDGSTDQDNFKYACETAGRRILAVNPHLLILCEGIQIHPKDGADWSSTDAGDYHSTWWGGNLRGVRDHPVDLGAHGDQLVYSPHDYGPLVAPQPWFTGDWNRATLERDVWDPNWLYLHKENTAPVLIGEWGGFLDGGPNEKWMTALRDLIAEQGLHHTFWCLNPNSGDTGGLLLGDWKTWDEEKYALLKPALWQHRGKFVGLDHRVPLGGAGSATGLSLTDVYGDGGGGPADTAPPTAPTGLTATETGATSVTLRWSPSTDDTGVTGYDVHRDGVRVTAAPVTGTTWTDTGLTPATRHTYTVRARDAAGNTSAPSAALTVTTAPAGGGEPAGTLKVLHRTTDGSLTDNAIRPELRIANTGAAPVDLAAVTARYYFTRDGGAPTVGAWCDHAALGCAGVRLRVVPLPAPVAGADAYLEVGFAGGTLAAGRDTGEIQLRMSKSDWSAFDERDDHSRAPSSAFTDARTVPAYTGTALVWGAPPA